MTSRVSVVTLLCLGLGPPSASVYRVVVGPPRIIDADTLELCGERIRLTARNVLESKQLCAAVDGRPYRGGRLVVTAGWGRRGSSAAEPPPAMPLLHRIPFPSQTSSFGSGWSATRKLSRHGGDFSGKIGLKGGGGFCHEKEV